MLRAQEEVKRIQSVPLVIGQFLEAVDENTGIVGSTTGNNYYVRILSTINRESLKPNASVALHRHSNALVEVLPPEADSSISMMQEKPKETYSDIGGSDIQKQEIREAVELPLTQFELYPPARTPPPRRLRALPENAVPCEQVQADRDRPAARRAAVRSAGHREDDVGEGRRAPHLRVVHRGRGVGVCAEVPGRGAAHG